MVDTILLLLKSWYIYIYIYKEWDDEKNWQRFNFQADEKCKKKKMNTKP